MLPKAESPEDLDFVTQEFDSIEEIVVILLHLEETYPEWKIISFCHVEVLPLLIEPLRKTFLQTLKGHLGL